MKPVATLANAAWLAASVPAWQRFRRALQHPAETQQQILRNLLRNNAGSAYGRAHRFGEIRTVAEFRERVPIVDYDDLEPWVARITRGEQGVLTRETVTRLVPTSGSTGGRKLIPFTASLQREFSAAISPWIVELFRRERSLFVWPCLLVDLARHSPQSPMKRPRCRSASTMTAPTWVDSDSGSWKRRLPCRPRSARSSTSNARVTSRCSACSVHRSCDSSRCGILRS